MTNSPNWPQGQPTEPAAPYDYQAQGYTPEAGIDTVSTSAYAPSVDPYAVPDADVYTPIEDSPSTTDVAKDEAANVKDTAVDAGKNVAATAKDEAANVASEAKDQAKGLLSSVGSQVKDQAGTQQQKLAETVHSFAKQLGGMASGDVESGPLTDLAKQASAKVGEIGHLLENKEPREILDDVSAFARRRPGLFLVLCGAAGVLAGRVTRGAVAANTSVDSPKSSDTRPALDSAPSTGSYYAEPVAPQAVAPVYTDAPAYGSDYVSDRI